MTKSINQEILRVTSPQWVQFIRYCGAIEFGEIEKLKIQNGVPVLAEVATKKIKFS